MTDDKQEDTVPTDARSTRRARSSFPDPLLRNAILGIFVILATGVLYFGKDFLMPVTLGFLLALVLAPVVRSLRRRGVPEGVTAVGIVAILVAALVAGGYSLSGPVTQWMNDAPSIAREIQRKTRPMQKPVEHAAKQVQEFTQREQSDGVQRVVVNEPGLLSRAATGTPDVIAKIGLTLILLLFLLSSGDMFYEKLVKTLPTFADKKRGVMITRRVEREISRYLFAVSVINVGLGIAVGVAMYFLGMPSPLLWGVVAALLNFLPYLGALIGIALVAAVAFVSFDTLPHILIAPGLYLAFNIIEGQFITPMAVGRRLEINAVAIFIAMAFWGWLWGFIGVFLAVPILVVIKVIADHTEGLGGLGEFLAARETNGGDAAESQAPRHSERAR